jgi:hypothetical protein
MSFPFACTVRVKDIQQLALADGGALPMMPVDLAATPGSLTLVRIFLPGAVGGVVVTAQSVAVIPAAAVVVRMYTEIDKNYPPGTTIVMGQTGLPSLLGASPNDVLPGVVGLYDAGPLDVLWGATLPLLATIQTPTPGGPTGAGVLLVEYAIPLS